MYTTHTRAHTHNVLDVWKCPKYQIALYGIVFYIHIQMSVRADASLAIVIVFKNLLKMMRSLKTGNPRLCKRKSLNAKVEQKHIEFVQIHTILIILCATNDCDAPSLDFLRVERETESSRRKMRTKKSNNGNFVWTQNTSNESLYCSSADHFSSDGMLTMRMKRRNQHRHKNVCIAFV